MSQTGQNQASTVNVLILVFVFWQKKSFTEVFCVKGHAMMHNPLFWSNICVFNYVLPKRYKTSR
jgi:hypothetical protein